MSKLSQSFSQPQFSALTPSHLFFNSPLQNCIKLPKLHNFSTSPSLNSSLLNQIKTRNNKKEEIVDPVLAAKIVKNYLLPMFEKNNKKITNANRKKAMGLNQNEVLGSRDSTAESTVYEELKLSEKLLIKLESLTEKAEKAEENACLFGQEKFELLDEIKILKQNNETLATNFEIGQLQLNEHTKISHSNEMKMYFILKQLEHYRKLYKASEEKLHELSQDLHNERNINDIRL